MVGTTGIALGRPVMACVGLGVTFVLDDPAKPTAETLPVPAWLGALVRAVSAAVVGGACWTAALIVTRSGQETASLPYADLTREAATVAAVAFLASAIGWRRSPRGIGSPLAAPVLLLGMTVVALLPAPVALLVGVGDGWGAATTAGRTCWPGRCWRPPGYSPFAATPGATDSRAASAGTVTARSSVHSPVASSNSPRRSTVPADRERPARTWRDED
ncbi:hypothetical protein AB0J94_28285 [Micromonospora noduli]|uniref:hypothetical protein n=1 Tax=Micromonospora noduli TaxID=709876 RepID=UPI0034284173